MSHCSRLAARNIDVQSDSSRAISDVTSTALRRRTGTIVPNGAAHSTLIDPRTGYCPGAPDISGLGSDSIGGVAAHQLPQKDSGGTRELSRLYPHKPAFNATLPTAHFVELDIDAVSVRRAPPTLPEDL